MSRIAFVLPFLAFLTSCAVTGQARGVSVDLTCELGRRVGVPIELVPFNTAGNVVDAFKAGTIEVGFVAEALKWHGIEGAAVAP